METFRGTLELVDQPDSRLPVEIRLDRDRLSIDTAGRNLGDWSLAEVDLATAVEGFSLRAENVQMRLRVHDADRFWSALSATEQQLIERLRPAPSEPAGWWRFWSPAAWRQWRARRAVWRQHRADVAALDRELTEVEASDAAASIQREELERRRTGIASPPRPVSPAWVPAAVMVVVLGALGAGADDPDPPPDQAAPPATATATTPTATATTPTSTGSPATTSPTAAPDTTTAPDTTATTTGSGAAAGAPVDGEMEAHFFDVGQGDATLLAGPDFTILVDAGRHDRADVIGHLQRNGVEGIDLLIGTHPHADHIGQLPEVLATFPVTEVWMSGDTHTSLTYEQALDAIEASDAGYHEPRAGESYQLGSARVEVVAPAALDGDLNGGSVAVRVVYGEVAFLLTGDAESDSEAAMVDRGHALAADVLQVGHHGSSDSSSESFLQAVGPEVAVYSAGGDNQYGHPHREVIDRLTSHGAEVYGTDVHGTVIVTTDGSSISVRTDDPALVDAPATSTAPSTTGAATRSGESACGPGQIDINTAGAEALQDIIHIGPERADQILQLRPFGSVGSMDRISGIGPARLDDIRAQGVACAG